MTYSPMTSPALHAEPRHPASGGEAGIAAGCTVIRAHSSADVPLVMLHIKRTGPRRDGAMARGQAGIVAVQCLEGEAVGEMASFFDNIYKLGND